MLSQVFPESFNRPNLHALLHLERQARLFGTLRNISVATKEMVHRLHKAVAPQTNKQDVLRDLMVHENMMQGLRFLAEGGHDQDGKCRGGLVELVAVGLFESVYFEPRTDALARGKGTLDLTAGSERLTSGDKNFIGVEVRGGPWSAARVSSVDAALPFNRLSDIQMGELFKAYESIGISALQTNSKVSFFSHVSYWVRGRPSIDSVDQADHRLQTGEDASKSEYRKVEVSAGDVVEFVDDSSDSFRGRGFGRVVCAMLHERTVFIVTRWIVSTGGVHARLGLPEFRDTQLFYYAAFQPLSIVDHPRFVNSVFFALLDGRLYLNEWVFKAV